MSYEINNTRPDLMAYLYSDYKSCKEMTGVQNTNSYELARINYIIDDMAKQFAISTTTWGLDLWEFEYGIITDYNKSYEQRREILKAKERGQGTTTKEMLKNTAQAYSNGEVDIIEIFEYYRFIVKFIGTKGIPEQLDELDKTIRQSKPAHLAHEYEFTYMTWNEFDNYNNTWDEWDNKNLTWDELEIYRQKGAI